MKKIIILFLVLCGAGLGTSCDDFLTEHPSTQFSPEDVYSSPNGVQAVLNSCYGYISQSNGYGGYLHMLLSWHTPTMQLQNRNSTYMVELATMNVAVDNSTADYVYDGAYQTINTVNDLLMNIGLCSGMSEAEHNRIEGEARLLRALSYFNLVRIFGALPYIDRPAASIEESHKPRTSIDRIYGLIIGDLEQAWNMLPEKGAHAHGRPHKWAAKAFLAKVYVALACIKEHPGEPFDAALFDKSAKEYWQLAYDNAKEVYDSHAYSLVPNFADLWVYTNKHTEESILEMEMNYVTGSCPFMYRYLPGYWEGVPLTNSANNYGQIRPSREAWDEHNDRYPGDWREECTYLDYKYKCNTTVENENYRGKQYYIYPYTKENYPDQSTSKYEYLPYLRKWVDPTFTAGNANVNFIVYRYADLLLTLAEAANELGGAHTREAVGYVNEVLFRARNASNEQRTEPADWDAGLSQEEIRAALRVERRCELKGELHEWFDSRRFGVAYLTGLIDIHNARIAETASLSPYDYVLPNGFNEVKKNLLLPFPNAEISANYNISASDQNFGY